jgi:hypothetical protein
MIFESSLSKHLKIVCTIFILTIFNSASIAQVIFNDTYLENCLLGDANVNTNGDGTISMMEAQEASIISCRTDTVKNLLGLEDFTNLQQLQLRIAEIDSIDLNFTDSLIYVSIQDVSKLESQKLKDIQMSSSEDLEGLTLIGTGIASLDFSPFDSLEGIIFRFNAKLLTLDVSTNLKLRILYSGDGVLENIVIGSGSNKIEQINVKSNMLESIDLTGLLSLNYLDCGNNRISTLSMSSNSKLERVFCSGNEISELVTSGLSDLTHLKCDTNLISELDLSANTKLSEATVNNNVLEQLNLKNGNNESLVLNAKQNPNLLCITVDDIAWSDINWSNKVDAQTGFSLSCLNSIESISDDIKIFPNPTKGNISITGYSDFEWLSIYNVSGEKVKALPFEEKFFVDLPAGLYIFTFTTEDGVQSYKRVIVQK